MDSPTMAVHARVLYTTWLFPTWGSAWLVTGMPVTPRHIVRHIIVATVQPLLVFSLWVVIPLLASELVLAGVTIATNLAQRGWRTAARTIQVGSLFGQSAVAVAILTIYAFPQ